MLLHMRTISLALLTPALLTPALLTLLMVALSASGQQAPAAITRVAGTDAGSGIEYALISVEGHTLATEQPAIAPKLTAQCTRDKSGKLRFELLMDEGGVAELKYFPPWKATKDSPFPRPFESVTVTMEYLGYVKEKPVKRQWDRLQDMPEELMYSTPKLSSKNLEDVTRCLQYLRALPRLRLSIPQRPVLEFETLAWQAKVKAEPLCGASGL